MARGQSVRKRDCFRHVPSLLLGHIARDQRYKKKGSGRVMLDWVFSKASSLADEVGCRFVILDSEREMVKLYESYDFELIPPADKAKTYIMFFDLGIRNDLVNDLGYHFTVTTVRISPRFPVSVFLH